MEDVACGVDVDGSSYRLGCRALSDDVVAGFCVGVAEAAHGVLVQAHFVAPIQQVRMMSGTEATCQDLGCAIVGVLWEMGRAVGVRISMLVFLAVTIAYSSSSFDSGLRGFVSPPDARLFLLVAFLSEFVCYVVTGDVAVAWNPKDLEEDVLCAHEFKVVDDL